MKATLPFLALLAATPAMAEGMQDTSAFSTAAIACLTVGVDPRGLEMVLGKSWGRQDDTEQGLANFTAPQDETVFVYSALDGRFCHVESLALPTRTAMEVTTKAFADLGLTATPGAKDELGCETLDLPNGWSVSVLSGGQDPVCADDNTSAMRVTYRKN